MTRSGGPYLFINPNAGEVKIPRHDGTGIRIVRGGEGFYGPAFYDKYVSAGMLARVNAEIATVVIPVYPQDLTPPGTTAIQVGNTWVLPPHRYQRGLDEALAVTPTADEVVTNSCVGLPKVRLSFSYDSTDADAVHVTYYFYTSSVVPATATHVIEKTQIIDAGWTPPRWGELPSDFYDLGARDQVEKLLETG